MLGTRTWGGRMIGADESTELWPHPSTTPMLWEEMILISGILMQAPTIWFRQTRPSFSRSRSWTTKTGSSDSSKDSRPELSKVKTEGSRKWRFPEFTIADEKNKFLKKFLFFSWNMKLRRALLAGTKERVLRKYYIVCEILNIFRQNLSGTFNAVSPSRDLIEKLNFRWAKKYNKFKEVT